MNEYIDKKKFIAMCEKSFGLYGVMTRAIGKIAEECTVSGATETEVATKIFAEIEEKLKVVERIQVNGREHIPNGAPFLFLRQIEFEELKKKHAGQQIGGAANDTT